jgi:hypothetical protein
MLRRVVLVSTDVSEEHNLLYYQGDKNRSAKNSVSSD